jgi:hypothetical protein
VTFSSCFGNISHSASDIFPVVYSSWREWVSWSCQVLSPRLMGLSFLLKDLSPGTGATDARGVHMGGAISARCVLVCWLSSFLAPVSCPDSLWTYGRQGCIRYTDWKWEGKVTSKWQMCAPFKLKNLGASVPLCDVSCKYAWASNSGEWDQKVLTGWGAGPPGYPKAGVWGTKAGSLKEAVSREWAALGIYCKRHIVRFKRKQKLAASSMFHKPVGFYWCCFCFFFLKTVPCVCPSSICMYIGYVSRDGSTEPRPEMRLLSEKCSCLVYVLCSSSCGICLFERWLLHIWMWVNNLRLNELLESNKTISLGKLFLSGKSE